MDGTRGIPAGQFCKADKRLDEEFERGAHPLPLQLERPGLRIHVNLPDLGQIADITLVRH